MHIKRLKIENIRGIENLDLGFHPGQGQYAGWTVIAGPNGSGKTAVLQSIAATVAGPENVLVMMDRACDFVRACAHEGRTDVWLGGSAEDVRSWQDDQTTVHLGVTWEATGGTRAHPERRPSFAGNQFWGGAAMGCKPEGWCLAAYGSRGRRGGRPDVHSEALLASVARRAAIVTLFRDDATLIANRQRVRDLRRTDLPGTPYNRVTGLIRWILAEGLVTCQPVRGLLLSSLGSGRESLVLLVLDIFRQMEAFYGNAFLAGFDWEDPYAKVPHSGVVLIDAIEANLDEDMQGRVGAWFERQFPNVQFIVTTSSRVIREAVDSAHLIQLGG